VRRSELRRVGFGQYVANSQCFRPDFEVTDHQHQHFLVNWYPRVVEHHRGDEGAAKAELVAQDGDSERRSSWTEVNSRLCLRVFGLSLCGFGLCQNHAIHNGQMKCLFHLCIPTQPFYGIQTSRSVDLMSYTNKSTRVLIPRQIFSSVVVTHRAYAIDTFVQGHASGKQHGSAWKLY
jgi:hypothetical protein